jgi:hypothetical protein
MAQLAKDRFLPFSLYQFYPTNLDSSDRDNHSFIIILEKVGDGVSTDIIRRSYLNALGE